VVKTTCSCDITQEYRQICIYCYYDDDDPRPHDIGKNDNRNNRVIDRLRIYYAHGGGGRDVFPERSSTRRDAVNNENQKNPPENEKSPRRETDTISIRTCFRKTRGFVKRTCPRGPVFIRTREKRLRCEQTLLYALHDVRVTFCTSRGLYGGLGLSCSNFLF